VYSGFAVSKDAAIKRAVDEIVGALGPNDRRSFEISNDRGSASIQRLIHAVLVDRELEQRVISLALWLSRLFPSPGVVKDIVGVLRERRELAVSAGGALARLGNRYDLSEVQEILLDLTLSSECRIGAARALAAWSDRRVNDVLRRALFAERQNVTVLREVIQALAWAEIRGQVTNAAEDIRGFLRADSPDVRYSALVALGNLGATEVIDDVAAHLNDDGITSFGDAVSTEAQRVVRLLKGL
jgi:HEAT repeat protein